jgi:hypothetical protein
LECFEDLRVEEIFEIIPETEPELFRGSKIIRKGEILGEKNWREKLSGGEKTMSAFQLTNPFKSCFNRLRCQRETQIEGMYVPTYVKACLHETRTLF